MVKAVLILACSILIPWVVSAQETSREIAQRSPRQAVALAGSYSYFDDITDWQEAFLEYKYGTRWITGVGRTNFAHRFDSSGVQWETDLYPKFGPVYAYLNLGYSPYSIFPEFRYGGELYGALPMAFELSAGFRRLHFDTDRVTMYTGSVGKYLGNYWFSLRPFVTPRSAGSAVSLVLFIRRYLSTADSYITLLVGGGSSVTEIVVTGDLDRLNTYKASIEGKTPIRKKLFALWSAGYDREELTFGRKRNRVTLKAGLEVLF